MTRMERLVHQLELRGWEVVRHKKHTVLKRDNYTLILSKTPRSISDLENMLQQLERRAMYSARG